MSETGFLERVRASLDRLHPAERRLAVFLLDFPGELAAYTAQELAGFAQVSAPTVSRFIKRLGYSSYEEARRHVRTARQAGSALYMVRPGDSAPEAFLQAHVQQAQANIDAMAATLQSSRIEALAEAIPAARRVWLIGFRTSYAFVNYLYLQIYQVCPQASLVPLSGQTMAEHLAALQPGDLVIIIGMARRPKNFPAILQALRNSGAQIAYFSDEGEALQEDLGWHLRCSTAGPGPLYNHLALMLLLQILASRVVELSGTDQRRHLALIEDLHRDLNEI